MKVHFFLVVKKLSGFFLMYWQVIRHCLLVTVVLHLHLCIYVLLYVELLLVKYTTTVTKK